MAKYLGKILSISLILGLSILSVPNCGARVLTKVKKYNLGLVISNEHLTIYRSSQLGTKGLAFLKGYLNSKKLPFPKTIVYLNKEGYKKNAVSLFRDFAIDEYKLQERYQFKFFHSFDYLNRTFLDGQNPYLPTDDIDSRKNLGLEAIRIFGLHYDGKKDGDVDDLVRIMEIILDKKNQPVLFHCYGGRHRSGIVGMTIRYLQGGDWVSGNKRRVFIPSKLKYLWLNPAQFEYAFYNKEMFRQDNIKFIEKFVKDKRFLKLQEKYKDQLQENDSYI